MRGRQVGRLLSGEPLEKCSLGGLEYLLRKKLFLASFSLCIGTELLAVMPMTDQTKLSGAEVTSLWPHQLILRAASSIARTLCETWSSRHPTEW